MAVPRAATELDCANSEQGLGRGGLVGRRPRLPRYLGGDGAKVRADLLSAFGHGRRRRTAVPGVDARRRRPVGSQRTCSRWEGGPTERRSGRDSPRRDSRRPARPDFEGILATSARSAAPRAREKGRSARGVPTGRGGIPRLSRGAQGDVTGDAAGRAACLTASVHRDETAGRSHGQRIRAVAELLRARRNVVAGVSRARGLHCIAGGCPRMYCPPVDFGHRCMRWRLRWRARVPG
jgi:hypothetical protein